MLFTSEIFVLAFLPSVLVLYYLLGRSKRQWPALCWLVVASLGFYCYWNPKHLVILVGSILVNYGVGWGLQHPRASGPFSRGSLLATGIVFNLGLLGYFKYSSFFLDNLAVLTGSPSQTAALVLPLAISFFTFQQIAYLVDAYRGWVKDSGFLHYCLFVTFFPQLIAGPIVHHKEVIPQFSRARFADFDSDRLIIGSMFLAAGFFKKLVLADNLALHADPAFDAALSGLHLGFFEAWAATLSFTFQIYFDFSGYTDMAIGLAWMFGIRLPENFTSPYKSPNIIEFWRRWHMTLSRFLRDYLYIPLGGNRFGQPRRYLNLGITMLLGGLWHGAGWGFIVWGALHGGYLMINHAFRAFRPASWQGAPSSRGSHYVGVLLTFFAVTIGWVFFRAESLDAAWIVLQGMFSRPGVIDASVFALRPRFTVAWAAIYHGWLLVQSVGFLLLVAGCVTWLLPNTYEFVRRYVLDDSGEALVENFSATWRGVGVGVLIGIMGFTWLLSTFSAAPAKFIYFDF